MKKIIPTLLVLFCFALMSTGSVMGYSTGVKSGSYAKYDYNVSAAAQTVTGTIRINFQTVTATSITGTVEFNIQGYPAPTQSFTIDISTWSVSGVSGLGILPIPANLTTGQNIPGLYQTVQNISDWQGRKAIEAYGSVMGIVGQMYFDQETGVFLEIRSTMPGVTGSIKLTDTDLFSVGGFNWLILVVIIVVIVAVIVVAVILMRKRKGVAAPPAPPPSETPPPPSE